MQPSDITHILRTIAPFFPMAGTYALSIQSRIAKQDDKADASEDPFGAALTDADLSLQNFFEVISLALFPSLGFYGEEIKSSLNAKYFSSDTDYFLTLDPIDGTRYYAAGSPLFNIILNLCSKEEILANIIYHPAARKGFVCIAEKGAFAVDETSLSSFELQHPVSLNTNSRRIVMYRGEQFRPYLEGEYEVIDVGSEFCEDPAWPHDLIGILHGNHGAVITTVSQLIDCVSIAFSVREAGGFVSDLRGEPVHFKEAVQTLTTGPILMAASEHIGRDILGKINRDANEG